MEYQKVTRITPRENPTFLITTATLTSVRSILELLFVNVIGNELKPVLFSAEVVTVK